MLLTHFHQVSEAPDAIPRLRRFILDLAVRGKLVSQDQNDEPASELLKRIQTEKDRITPRCQGPKKEKLLPPVGSDEFPFELPRSWAWCCIGDVAQYGIPDKVGSNKEISEDTWVLDLEDVEKDTSRLIDRVPSSVRPFQSTKTIFKRGDVLFGKLRPYLNKVLVADRDGVCTTEIVPIRGYRGISPEYMKLVLKSPLTMERVDRLMYGMKMPRLGTSDAIALNFPLPPLAEQHRIVAKVNELTALCDELEAAQTKREKRRDRLVAATLHGLSNGTNGENFHDTARFYFNHLQRLTTRPEHIQQLGQAILSLAVHGKLVPQDPDDEPIKSLISLIQSERKQRANKGISMNMGIPIDSESGEFSIPQSWRWVRLGFVLNVVMGQSPPGETYNTEGEGVPLINGPVEFSEGPFGKTIVNQYTTKPTKLCRKGDLLLCVRGSTTGRTNIAGFDACIGRGVAALQPLYPDQFIRLFIWLWRNQIIEMGRGIAFPSISRQQIEGLPVPLPPLAEQHRIVVKVEELMAICDELEARLTTTSTPRRQLLESALNEARFPKDQPQKTT